MKYRTEPTPEEQVITDYLIPEKLYQKIWYDIVNDINHREERTLITVLRDRFLKVVPIVFSLSNEEYRILKRRTLGRFNSLVGWIQSGGHLVPGGTEFPFQEDE